MSAGRTSTGTSAASAGRTSISSSEAPKLAGRIHDISGLFAVLLKEYGDPGWWSGDAFEIAIGAILTQRTAWRNVDRALAKLKERGLMSPRSMAEAKLSDIKTAVKPAGFYTQKARYLKAFASHILREYGGDMVNMKARPMDELRDELLGIPGIGPETADSILLYAMGRPSFVVDAYTFRLLERLGMKPGKDYGRLKSRFERELGADVKKLADMHALIVEHCKRQCTAGARCGDCCVSARCPSKR